MPPNNRQWILTRRPRGDIDARVIGISGGPEKCNWIVRELGFDAAID